MDVGHYESDRLTGPAEQPATIRDESAEPRYFLASEGLCPRLARLTGKAPPRYRKLGELMCDGTIPSVTIRGRRYIREADLPAIAMTLGLLPGYAEPLT